MDEQPGYQGQLSCAAAPLPGLVRLAELISSTYDRGSSVASVRSCAAGGTSEHKEGRALVWMLDVHDKANRRVAGDFLGWLTADDGVMARRLGVMYVIYDEQVRSAYSPGDSRRAQATHLAVPLPVDAVWSSQRPLLWMGSSGTAVSELQRRLGGSATGTLGTVTRSAVLAYQREHDLPRTGAVDDPTWSSLGSGTLEAPAWSPAEAAAQGRAMGSPEFGRKDAGQPSLSWLALGSGIAVSLTMVATGLLAAYVHVGDSFGNVYGPLGGVFALLLWSLLSSMALFYGAAVCAQLEACRAGVPDPAYADPGRPHSTQVPD